MNRRAWFELIVLAGLWGAVYPLIEVALRDLSPTVVVLGRVLFACILLVPLAIRRNALPDLWQRPRAIIETVLVQSTVPLLLLTYGQRYVPAGIAGILIGAQPLFVAMLAYRYAPDERPQGWRGVIGIAVGFVGLTLLFGVDLRGGRLVLLGGALVLVAALCYAAGAIMIHRRHATAPPLGVATSAMLVTSATMITPAALTLPDQLPGAGVLAAMVFLGVVCTGMTLVLFYTLIARTGPARAALAFYLSPAFAVVFGVAFLREQLTFTAVVGLGAIVAGCLLAAQRAEPSPA
ncbi:DMT family transporter [Micromonospora craniellae]|uniref:DMT family transporter n=1 Tax=Micromonospora craniellae TaxID=2294034 RepID=A0A372FRS1_9ACTN|nr:DMT family transporter [Micromonospora craniellae]QOC93911.1 DMT family transporter [Micromonospora craniellae]RFS43398.1 DMT family transporter [Micromonospora craniellae]